MNKKRINPPHTYYIYILGIVSWLMYSSCERRPLEDDTVKYAQVHIEIDWSKSGMEPGEASVVFYPQEGGEPTTVYLYGNKGTVELMAGKYSVITINHKYDDFDGIAFRGVERYNTSEAYLKPIRNPAYIPADQELTVDNPNMLASDSRDEFIVTQAMLDRTRQEVEVKNSATKGDVTPEIQLTMHLITVKAQVIVHVRNLYLIRKGTQNGVVKGFVEAVNLSTRQATSTPVTQFLELPKAEYYKDSPLHGWMEGTLTVFGECIPIGTTAQPVEFVLNAVLRDKKQTQFTHHSNITDLIEYNIDIGLNISFEIGADPEKENPPIEVPKVEPEDPNSGFQPGIDEWGDEEEITKPL